MKVHPIKAYRQAHDLTLAALAAKVGTTRSTLSRVEAGLLRPTHELLIRLSNETGLSIDEMVRASCEAA